MSHPLDGSRAKIERAKEHLYNLNGEIQGIADRNPYRVVTEHDTQTGEQVTKVRVTQPTLRWSAMVGDIAHNLRSALDHLVWQLVEANGTKPGTHNEFPVLKDLDRWDSKKYKTTGRGKVKGVSKNAMERIERLQPYHRGDDYKTHPLYIAHALNIRDKHRLLNLVSYVLAGGRIGFAKPGEMFSFHVETFTLSAGVGTTLKDGAELYRFRPGGQTPDMQMNHEFVFDVTFEQGGPGEGESVIPTLQQLIQFVEYVIGLFESEFR
jgi:hypothetical protein